MPDAEKKALSGLTLDQLVEFATASGLPAFRGKQLHTWIYAKYATSFDEMTDLSRETRELLKSKAQIQLLKLAHLEVSRDGTRKYLFELPDGKLVESVLMSFDDRSSLSACVSSQVGCAVGCTFCATGYMGFKRNLTSQEIVDQVMSIQRQSGQRISNIVYMGQGEPLLNVDNVTGSIRTLMQSVGIGARHITVSTSGIIPGIRALAREELQITLALSLHAPDNLTRDVIVPINKKFPVDELLDSVRQYYDATGRRITIEYVLLAGVTDSPEQARELAEMVRDIHCNVNLIPYNPTSAGDGVVAYERPSLEAQHRFKRIAESSGKTVTIRLERGTDINAACGQLHNNYVAGN